MDDRISSAPTRPRGDAPVAERILYHGPHLTVTDWRVITRERSVTHASVHAFRWFSSRAPRDAWIVYGLPAALALPCLLWACTGLAVVSLALAGVALAGVVLRFAMLPGRFTITVCHSLGIDFIPDLSGDEARAAAAALVAALTATHGAGRFAGQVGETPRSWTSGARSGIRTAAALALCLAAFACAAGWLASRPPDGPARAGGALLPDVAEELGDVFSGVAPLLDPLAEMRSNEAATQRQLAKVDASLRGAEGRRVRCVARVASVTARPGGAVIHLHALAGPGDGLTIRLLPKARREGPGFAAPATDAVLALREGHEVALVGRVAAVGRAPLFDKVGRADWLLEVSLDDVTFYGTSKE